MREIKFRAWDGERWLEEDEFIIYPGGAVSAWNENEEEEIEIVDLMQFTGLHDRKGVEIYEGDIVKWSSWDIRYKNSPDCKYKNKIINWSVNRGAWIVDDEETWNASIYNNMEVIGNIHENKELLKE